MGVETNRARPTNAIVNALILAYAKRTMPRSLEALKNFQAIREKYGAD